MLSPDPTANAPSSNAPRPAQSAPKNGVTSTIGGLAGVAIGALVERLGAPKEFSPFVIALTVGFCGAFGKIARDAGANGKKWGQWFGWIG